MKRRSKKQQEPPPVGVLAVGIMALLQIMKAKFAEVDVRITKLKKRSAKKKKTR